MKVGLIGLGHWGRNYLRVLQEMGHEIEAVSDASGEVLERVRARRPELAASTSAEVLLRSPRVEAVVIATPATTHFALTRRALTEGKHVLVEKPMALSVTEASELVELAERRQRVLMVGHTFLYNDAVRALRETVRDPESGRMYYLSARRNHLGMIRRDVSALWDLAPHDVAIASYLLEAQPLWVSAVEGRFLRPDVADAAFLSLGYADGVVARIEVSWADGHKVRDVVVVTSRRRIVFDDLELMEPLRIYEKGVTIEKEIEGFGEFQYLLRDGEIRSPRVERREPLRNQCVHFFASVESGTRPLTDGSSALEVVRVLAAAERSARQNGAPAPLR